MSDFIWIIPLAVCLSIITANIWFELAFIIGLIIRKSLKSRVSDTKGNSNYYKGFPTILTLLIRLHVRWLRTHTFSGPHIISILFAIGMGLYIFFATEHNLKDILGGFTITGLIVLFFVISCNSERIDSAVHRRLHFLFRRKKRLQNRRS